MTFKDNLRTFRLKNGLTAKALAEYLGISYSTYMGYENEGKEPKYDLLCKIAASLGCTPNDLLDFSPSIDESFIYYSDLMEDAYRLFSADVELLPQGQVSVKSSTPGLDCTFPSKENFVLFCRNAINSIKDSDRYRIAVDDALIAVLETQHNIEQSKNNNINHTIDSLQRSISEATTPEERGKLKQALKKALSELESSE